MEPNVVEIARDARFVLCNLSHKAKVSPGFEHVFVGIRQGFNWSILAYNPPMLQGYHRALDLIHEHL